MRAADGEWDGVCACGKAAQDGKKCKLGATHQPKEVKLPDDALDFLEINEQDDLDFLA